MRTLLTASIIFIASFTFAAPHPLTGSSLINKADSGMAFSLLGFSVTGIPDFWVFNKTIETSLPSLELGLPQKTLLSFRLENVSPKTQLETYVRQYLRDYNQYGFEVSGLQSLIRNDTPSVIVDLNQRNKTSRSRQMFFLKEGRLVIATCSDDSAKFNSTLSICNNILGSFKWN